VFIALKIAYSGHDFQHPFDLTANCMYSRPQPKLPECIHIAPR
jgi:hypothetical protein